MQGFIDFLNFRFFISPYVLVACYYIGVLGVPFGSWFMASWIKRKYWLASDAYESEKRTFDNVISTKERMILSVIFILFFICMEIMWRMMFEFLMAYLQMRDLLMELANH